MHKTIEPTILYFGTPVALISTLNEDGSSNIAPMSSVWWLGWSCMLGLGAMGKTSENLIRTRECVVNLGYVSAHRAERVRRTLPGSATVTEAIYGAGFNSNGRFYAAAPALLGMKPTKFRSGAHGEVIRFAVGECSLGAVLVAATDRGVCAISFGDGPDSLATDLRDHFPGAELVGGDDRFDRMVSTGRPRHPSRQDSGVHLALARNRSNENLLNLNALTEFRQFLPDGRFAVHAGALGPVERTHGETHNRVASR